MGYIGKVPADVLIDPHVDSAAITDGTIITADIANDAVTSAKLAENSVDSSELIDGSVDNSHLAGSIAVNKTLLTAGTGLTLTTNTLSVDAAQSQITSVGTLSSLTLGGDLTLPQKIVHSGDTDTYLSFGTDSLSLYTGGTNVVDFIYGNIYIKQNNKALTGYTTGGGAKELIKIDSSDVVQIGEGQDVSITGDGARFYVKSADEELISIGRAGSSGSALDQGYIRMKSGGTNKIAFHTAGDSYINGGSLGIGTTSVDTKLHLKDTGGIEVRLEADSNNSGQEDCFIRFYTDGKTQEGIVGMDNNNSSTLFSSNTENAMVFGCVSDLPVVFATNNTERMQITANGNVGIGTTSINANAKLHIRQASSSQTSSSNNTQLTIENSGNAGIQLLTGTSNVGGIWIGDSNGSEAGGKLYYSNNNDSWSFYNGGSTNSLLIESTGRMITSGDILPGADVILSNGRGISFTNMPNNANMTSELFDDYEEGTIDTSVQGITASTNSVTGTYTKVGRLVHVEVRVTISGKTGGSGNPYIRLPFNANGSGIGASIVGAQLSKNTIITGGSPAYLGLYGSTNQLYANDVSGNYIGEGDWGNGVLGFNLTYNT